MTNNYTGACDCDSEQDIIEVYDEHLTDQDIDLAELGGISAVCKIKCKACHNVYLQELALNIQLDTCEGDEWKKESENE